MTQCWHSPTSSRAAERAWCTPTPASSRAATATVASTPSSVRAIIATPLHPLAPGAYHAPHWPHRTACVRACACMRWSCVQGWDAGMRTRHRRGLAVPNPLRPADVDRRRLGEGLEKGSCSCMGQCSWVILCIHTCTAWRAQSGRQGVRAAGEAGCPGVCRPSSRSCLSCACAWCEPHRRGCASAQATRRALRAGAGDVGPVARGGAGCGCAAAAGCSCGYGLLVVRTGRARGWVLSGASSRRAAVAARLPAFACACAGGPRTGAGGTARPARWAAVPSLYCIPGCGGV